MSMQRREFLKLSAMAGGGIIVSGSMPAALARDVAGSAAAATTTDPVALSYFLEVHSDDRIRFLSIKHEMGQGVATSLAMILAEELGVDFRQVTVEFPSTGQTRYALSGTGGSTTVKDMYLPIRKAAALARRALVEVAAAQWAVDASSCAVADGLVRNTASGKTLRFGELARLAAERLSSLPATYNDAEFAKLEVPLKDAKTFTLIGTPVTNIFAPAIVSGEHRYAIDVKVDGMKYAAIARCPVFRGKLAGFDATRALQVPGVIRVVPIEGFMSAFGKLEGATGFTIKDGVAVIANSTWAAMRGRDALEVRWNGGANEKFSSQSWMEHVRQKFKQPPGEPLRSTGDKNALDGAGRVLDATYVFPYQAHLCMEPMNCVAHHRGDRCEVWVGSQAPQGIVARASQMFGIEARNIIVNPLPSGGGFGRRFYPDVALEALKVSLAAGNIPVKVVWSREDDIRNDGFHAFYYADYRARLDEKGVITAWGHREGRTFWGDPANEMPWIAYDIPNTRYDFVSLHADSIVQSAAWRSVVANNWAFGQEGFIDELAVAAGVDPYGFRVKLLESGDEVDVGHSNKLSRVRLRRVLDLAAEKSGWGRGKKGKGRGQGIAVFPYMHGNSYAALVVDVVVIDGRIRVERAVAAVDVGRVINPSGLRQQIEGGIVWGLTAALYGGIDIQNGRVMNGNFNDTPVVRMNECPPIEVHFIDNPGEAPHGSGELSPPLVAPALANAIFAATGKRLRQLPFSLA